MLGPILVTLAYLMLYYVFILNQLRVKTRLKKEYAARGETFDRYFNTDRHMLAADRYVLNMLEQMPPFLAALWLCAAYVTPLTATWCGAIYLVLRALYPFALGAKLGRGVRALTLASTVPQYILIAYMLVRVLVATLG